MYTSYQNIKFSFFRWMEEYGEEIGEKGGKILGRGCSTLYWKQGRASSIGAFKQNQDFKDTPNKLIRNMEAIVKYFIHKKI